ncbi:MAG: hypothetical protein NT096_04325 [Proteobacteria bacterium]|nr:hypothetical protein [Pseudomonadota bacterium]
MGTDKNKKEIEVEKDVPYEPPKIVNYYEEELLDFMGPANTCSQFQTCAFFSGAIVGC